MTHNEEVQLVVTILCMIVYFMLGSFFTLFMTNYLVWP